MKKTYITPTAQTECIDADSLLVGSIYSDDANPVIDELNFDTEGENKISSSDDVW